MMNIHATTSAVHRTPLGMKPYPQQAREADQTTPAKGVEVMRREMAARQSLSESQSQPPDRLLKQLTDSTQLGRQPVKRALADAPATSAKLAESPPAPAHVALSDVKAALGKIGVEAVTENGSPMTQDWIAKTLETLNDAGGPEPMQSSTEPYEITIDGMMAHWGESNSIYDLTGNGTVDGEDLLLLLSNGGTMTVDAPHDMPPKLTLEGLLAAWGQSDSPYDLTGNGTVDGQDLLLFLQMMGGNNHDE